MMRLLGAYIIHYFGRDSVSPRRAAYLKLSLLFCITFSTLGIALRIIADTSFHESTNDLVTVVHILVIMQIAAFCLALFGTGLIRQASYKLVLILPVPQFTLWVIYMMPQLILLLVAACIFGVPLCLIGAQVGLHPLLCGLTILCALLSALSVLHSLSEKWNIVRWTCLPALLIAEALVLRHIQNGHDSTIWIVLLTACVLSPIFLLRFAYHQIIKTASQNRPQQSVRYHLAPSCWPIAKALRNNALRTSIITSFVISIVLAIGMTTSHVADPVPASILAALLAGSVATDIRSLCVKKKPAEICVLRGTPYFIWKCLTIYVLLVLGIAPLLTLIVLQANSPMVYLQCSAYIMAGICIGHLSGAWFAPSQRDISAQYVAVFTSSLLLWALLQTSTAITKDLTLQFAVIMFMCIALSLLQLVIEYRRNTFFWRNTCFRKPNRR